MTANSISVAKETIRGKMRKTRQMMRVLEFKDMGKAAQRRLMDSPKWQNVRGVGLYMALPDETPTDMLLEHAWAVGKTVWLPKIVDAALRKMEFLPCKSHDDLAPGLFGIMEPQTRYPFEEQFPEFIVIPGLAFDLDGYRLGYGGGYYDRWVFAHQDRDIHICGLAFDFQLVEKLPHESWDMRTDSVCTEEKIIWL